MKNKLVKLLLPSLLMMVMWSCKKDENQIFLEGGTAPALKASVTASIPLAFASASDLAIKLNWSNPDYRFTTGISSQDVTYLLEIDTTGANFTNPNKKSVSISKELEKSFTQSEINDFLLNQLVLVPGMPHDIEIRVVATLVNKSASLPSNTLKFTVTPYAIPPKVAVPTLGTLWVVGDASANGWANPLAAPYDVSQKFTQVSTTLYELTMPMPGGGGYKLIQENGVWGSQYHMLAGGTWEGGDFVMQDSDPQFPGPPSAGNYKITVDFQRGKFTVIKL